mmetsp:Transcript_40957/g.162166  ORF Transcript_40957/g.162166 Transcript_40957/m.162166 type:complete len:382 (-) Transcript_40957:1737-2882(-)
MADVKLDEHEVLWEPDERSLTRSALARFWAEAEKRSGQEFTEYETLHRWSVSSRDEFWKLVVEFLDLKSHGEIENVVGPGTDDRSKPELVNVVWFEGMKLCVAENLLQNRSDQTAIASYREDLSLWRSLSFKELYAEVNAVAGYCREVLGLKCGDIVAALMPHISDTIIVMLAVNSLGCVWTACSPDFGTIAVLDRFSQVRPKVLIVTDGYIYKGRKVDVNEKNGEIIDSLPSVEHVIFIPFTGQNHHNPDQNQHKRIEFKELTSYNPKVDLDSAFKRVPSDHPLYIMYSSGTSTALEYSHHGAQLCPSTSSRTLLQSNWAADDCRALGRIYFSQFSSLTRSSGCANCQILSGSWPDNSLSLVLSLCAVLPTHCNRDDWKA